MSKSMEPVEGVEQGCPECGTHALQVIGEISARCNECGELCAPCFGCNAGFFEHRGRRGGENISTCDTCTCFIVTPEGDSR